MIRFLTGDQIDKQKWDALIQRSQFPTIFASYEFLSIASQKWGALVENDYEAGFPLPYHKKWGISYIYSPPFISRLGLFSIFPFDDSKIAVFIKHIPKQFKLVELILNPTNQIENAIYHTSYTLNLNQNYADIQKKYSENTKRNIKTALKFPLQVTHDIPLDSIIHLFQENRGKKIKNGIPDYHYHILNQLVNHADYEGKIEYYGVRDEDQTLLAGAVFLIDVDRIWFWFSGRNNQFSEKRAMFYLIDQFIQQHSSSKYLLDFNGSNNPDIARFYAGFGAQSYSCPFLVKKDLFTNFFIKWYKKWKK
ncbi:MAG: aminoacyltransferase [Bacteroidetes bacterium]|nr:aminoacyltransferase [Bacteroidota bacterium]